MTPWVSVPAEPSRKMPSGGPEIEQLIQLLARLPGLGPRSARRAVLHLIKKKEQLMLPLSAALDRAVVAVKTCEICGNVDTISPCSICSDPRRGDSGILIVVEDVSDLWAMERAAPGQVRYHVLGGVLSPLDGIGPDDLSLDMLISRAPDYSEIVLAMNATVDGQTTAHYITDRLGPGTKVTRLAHGVPIGGELDYLDEGTLSQALRARTQI
ncbi:MAG: recombination mediator RecR [Devosia sp.]|uniref:recombination mediator RecR n=1 Tax=Devosia sp. TaxID=1871048 RepID=UPI003392B8CE